MSQPLVVNMVCLSSVSSQRQELLHFSQNKPKSFKGIGISGEFCEAIIRSEHLTCSRWNFYDLDTKITRLAASNETFLVFFLNSCMTAQIPKYHTRYKLMLHQLILNLHIFALITFCIVCCCFCIQHARYYAKLAVLDPLAVSLGKCLILLQKGKTQLIKQTDEPFSLSSSEYFNSSRKKLKLTITPQNSTSNNLNHLFKSYFMIKKPGFQTQSFISEFSSCTNRFLNTSFCSSDFCIYSRFLRSTRCHNNLIVFIIKLKCSEIFQNSEKDCLLCPLFSVSIEAADV